MRRIRSPGTPLAAWTAGVCVVGVHFAVDPVGGARDNHRVGRVARQHVGGQHSAGGDGNASGPAPRADLLRNDDHSDDELARRSPATSALSARTSASVIRTGSGYVSVLIHVAPLDEGVSQAPEFHVNVPTAVTLRDRMATSYNRGHAT